MFPRLFWTFLLLLNKDLLNSCVHPLRTVGLVTVYHSSLLTNRFVRYLNAPDSFPSFVSNEIMNPRLGECVVYFAEGALREFIPDPVILLTWRVQKVKTHNPMCKRPSFPTLACTSTLSMRPLD